MPIPNGLNPNIQAVNLAGSAYILGGVSTGTAAINAEVKVKAGPVGNGSIYLSQNGNGEVWVKVSGDWSQLTIN
jgi:hypothetical protein